MFNKFIKTQHVCISVDELFQWWDRLDKNPDDAFDLFTSFLEEAEDTLELDQDFIKSINEEKFVPLDCDDYETCDTIQENINTLTYALNGLKEVKSNLESDEEFRQRTSEALEHYEKQEHKPIPVKKFEDLFDVKEEDCTNFHNPYGWKVKKVL